MGKHFSIITVFILSLLLIQCGSDDKTVNKKLSQMAADINVSTPVMLDQFTRFDKAEVSDDNVFRYNYTVLNSSNPDSLIQVVSLNLTESIKREFSTNPELLFFKENNVVIEYVYKDESSKVIRLFSINPEEYQ